MRPELLAARQYDVAGSEAGEHRLDPLDPVADQRQDHVATSYAETEQRPGKAPRPVDQRCWRMLEAAAVVATLDEGDLSWVGGDDIAHEVEGLHQPVASQPLGPLAQWQSSGLQLHR